MHLMGNASRIMHLAVSIRVIMELLGLVSKNWVPVWLYVSWLRYDWTEIDDPYLEFFCELSSFLFP